MRREKKKREERKRRGERERGEERKGKPRRTGGHAPNALERLLPAKFFFPLSARDRDLQSRVADVKAKRVLNAPHANETQTVIDLEWRV